MLQFSEPAAADGMCLVLAGVLDTETDRETFYYYDLLDRLSEYREAGDNYDHRVRYGYDTENNLSKQVEKLNSDTYTTTYAYDSDNRITSVTSDGGTTALVFVKDIFAWSILFFAVVLLVRWELVAYLHPERFSERENACLSCANCQEKLCHHKKQLQLFWKANKKTYVNTKKRNGLPELTNRIVVVY